MVAIGTFVRWAVMMGSTYGIVDYNQNTNVDMRKFAIEFPQNKQDEYNNTFLHHLAKDSEDFEDWSEVMQRVEVFMSNNKNWMPNPFIHNKNGKTARQEAKKIFTNTGNPVSGVLVMYLKQMEDNTVNKLALKDGREKTILALQQGIEHPNK